LIDPACHGSRLTDDLDGNSIAGRSGELDKMSSLKKSAVLGKIGKKIAKSPSKR